jgi:hypothetical protein
MLPNIYADDICSLLENKNRYALSLILIINNDQLIEYKIINSIVKNIKNYSYDQFDKIKYINQFIDEFIKISNIFFEYYCGSIVYTALFFRVDIRVQIHFSVFYVDIKIMNIINLIIY